MALINLNLSPRVEEEKPKKIKAMDVALVIVLIITLVFTGVMIWLFIQFQTVPDTLITAFYAVVGGECGVMGWIKTSKEKNKAHNEEKTENEEAKG